MWSPTSTTKVVPSNFKDENGDIQISRIKVELKEESGVIKIKGLNWVTKFKDESGVIKLQG